MNAAAHPLLSSRLATAGHPLGVLLAVGGPLGGWLSLTINTRVV